MYKKNGNKENEIRGNKEEINTAGKALLSLEREVNGIIVNKTEKCKGKLTQRKTKKSPS